MQGHLSAAATKKKEIYVCMYQVSLVQLSPSRSVSSLSCAALSLTIKNQLACISRKKLLPCLC